MAGHPLMGTMEVKSVRTFPVILVKLVTPPLPPQTKLSLSTMGGNECLFWPQHCRGGGGGGGEEGRNPKQIKKLSLGAE